jgi:hypothetical protein
MTYVGIEGETNRDQKPKSKYMEETDKKIKDMLDDFDDIDNFLNDDEEQDYLQSYPEHREEVQYFKNMIAEVDSYKKNIKEEFDELQYLIKFVDDTKNRVSRHKYGVSNMFTQAGLKPVPTRYEDSDKENSDGEYVYLTGEGLYDKKKNMSKIKDNLFNLQSNVLDYYQKFNKNMKKIERDNKETLPNNNEFLEKMGRPSSSNPKLRSKSKNGLNIKY